VWAELVRRARAGDPAWTVGLADIAMPGLRRAVGSLAAADRGDPADLQSEVLTGFLAAVCALDPDDLERVPLASRLVWAAWRAGQEHAYADAGWASRRRDLPDWHDGPVLPWGHPDLVLAAAVREQVLTREQAELIGRNRLEGVPLSQIAAGDVTRPRQDEFSGHQVCSGAEPQGAALDSARACVLVPGGAHAWQATGSASRWPGSGGHSGTRIGHVPPPRAQSG
jgi:hypothetical protein